MSCLESRSDVAVLDLQLMSFLASMLKCGRLVCDGVSQAVAVALFIFLAYLVGGPSSIHCRSHGLVARHGVEF